MELTWVAIAASLSMGLGAALLFYFAVRMDWLKDIEDAKYQVFWSDLEEMVNSKRSHDGHQPQEKH
ncbi:MAG: hypothetical protein ABL967_06940 [Bryobacteraceae bacterium]